MTSTIESRLGVTPKEAVKQPVLVATTANITLSGEQTIDTVTVVSGDRVLVKDQTDGSENGIYLCKTGDWKRASDWNNGNDVALGQLVLSTHDGILRKVIFTGNISIGTTVVTFETFSIEAVDIEYQTATAGQTAFNLASVTYTPGLNHLQVYRIGVLMPPSDYTETDSSTITFSYGIPEGDNMTFIAYRSTDIGTADAANVSYDGASLELFLDRSQAFTYTTINNAITNINSVEIGDSIYITDTTTSGGGEWWIATDAATVVEDEVDILTGSATISLVKMPSTVTGDEVFDSTGGTETIVTATDSNGDTVDIERVDTITFAEQTSGRTMTLNITYPL